MVSQTKSRKIPTRKISPLFFAFRHGTENILIQHSFIRHRFTKIGSNCAGTIRNITFRHLTSGTGPTHNGGLFIGTARGEGGNITDITYEDIVISGRVNAWQTLPSSPIRMSLFYHPAREHSGMFQQMTNLTFRNIVAEAAPMPNEPFGPAEVGQFVGLEGMPIRGLTLDNVTILSAPGHGKLATWRCEHVDKATLTIKDVSPPWTCD